MQFLLTSNLFKNLLVSLINCGQYFLKITLRLKFRRFFFGEFLVVLCLERVHLASSLGFLCTLYNISLTISVLPVDKLHL